MGFAEWPLDLHLVASWIPQTRSNAVSLIALASPDELGLIE